ncbi:MAG: rubrerythrin family protein [Paramuribaculum sp.]|nr:rubrerythrin family protein [Paramuribaculum sp.]MDE6459429.1 rubrerythrin family protein [Paramuribaculum sp.]
MATPNLKGTQTEKNIVSSYLNETQSYARYTYYAQQADKENYFPIGEIFRETADNELHHAKVFLKMLGGGNVIGNVSVDALPPTTTAENLQVSIGEEEVGGVQAYHEFAKVAQQEGFDDIASHFLAIAEAEQHHLDRFTLLHEQVVNGTVWKRDKPIMWRCLVCGYMHEGTTPPVKCPACDHPYQHYMPLDII